MTTKMANIFIVSIFSVVLFAGCSPVKFNTNLSQATPSGVTPEGSPTPGGSPSPNPTPGGTPTPGPSTSPTPGPTVTPTPGPTTGPTATPTPGPTTGPTATPTPGPTTVPTATPTPGPTTGPTATPTPPPGLVTLSPYINAVAFEDLYYPPGTKPATNRIPDYDYNDFLTEFQITEKANSSNDITDIYIDFYPRAVGAGDDHSFKLVLTGKVTGSSANSSILPITKPMFQGKATVTLSYFDENGKPKGTTTSPAYDQDIIVFSSTHATLGDPAGSSAQLNTLLPAGYTSGVPSNYREAVLNARIHVQLLSPTLNPAPSNGLVDASTFRVILHDLKSNYDIDIINVDNHNFDVNGYPWGFIIPTSWQWMQEGELIDSGYPEFAQYKNFLLGKPATGDYMNWFKYPVADPNKTILYPVIPFAPFLPAP